MINILMKISFISYKRILYFFLHFLHYKYNKLILKKKITKSIDNEAKILLNYYYRLLIKEDRNREDLIKSKDGVYFDLNILLL